MSILSINTSTGIVTSTNTSQLRIVTQTGSTGWNNNLTNVAQTVGNINRITIHYTGANSDGPVDMTLSGLNATWENPNRPEGAWILPGYHFVIRPNGDVWQIGRINRVSFGAAPHNTNNIHIAVMGLFWDGVSARPRRNDGTLIASARDFAEQQRTALQRLVQGLLTNSTLPRVTGNNHVYGHRHLPGQTTYCPGMTRANVHAAITPVAPPRITVQPESIRRDIGQHANFTVTATGTARSYQWQWRNASGGWQAVLPINGAINMNTRAFTQNNVTANMDGWAYRVVVTNAGGSVTSNIVTLSVGSTYPSTFRISGPNTFVGSLPNSGQIASIGPGGTFRRNGERQLAGNWTWLRGHLSGFSAVDPNRLVWIATTRLERAAGGTECPITDPANFGFTNVRQLPAGPNVGIIPNTISARFRPTGDVQVVNGHRWRLGTIMNTSLPFNNTTLWVATSQFPVNSPCR